MPTREGHGAVVFGIQHNLEPNGNGARKPAALASPPDDSTADLILSHPDASSPCLSEVRHQQQSALYLADVPVEVMPATEGPADGVSLPHVESDLDTTQGRPQWPASAGRLDGPARTGVLIVDDEAGVRSLLEKALRPHGFNTWLAASGEAAIEVISQQSTAIDVVLLDVHMPGMDGPQTLLGLRRIDPEIPAVFMSGCTGRYSAEYLQGLGASLIEKPFPSLNGLAGILRHTAKNSGRIR